jgi:chemotaxis protein histidine kinase CheA
VRVGGEVYAIPLESVSEIVSARRAEVHSVQGQRVARVRAAVVPIFLLEDLPAIRRPELRTACVGAEAWTIVIVEARGGRIGLVVIS